MLSAQGEVERGTGREMVPAPVPELEPEPEPGQERALIPAWELERVRALRSVEELGQGLGQAPVPLGQSHRFRMFWRS